MARHPGMGWAPDPVSARSLQAGDVVKMPGGGYHYIQYVNSSGAYAVPLASLTREIQGHVVNFHAGGKTISAHSIVEVVNPLVMGGNSQEYRRYVKMSDKSGTSGNGKVGGVDMDSGTPLGDFDSRELSDLEQESGAIEGQSVAAESATPTKRKREPMARKVKAKTAGNGAAKSAKREKAPKTVRKCACACGTETTGYFAPGHDARLHGWISKLAKGKLDLKEVPASVRTKLDLVETKTGWKAQKPEFYKHAD